MTLNKIGRRDRHEGIFVCLDSSVRVLVKQMLLIKTGQGLATVE